ncbi:MAG: IPT/TIG domain-containing protein [Acidobacteriota bacterium]
MCKTLTPLNSSFLLLAAIGLLACRTSSNERITAPTAPFADDVVGEIEPLGLEPGAESEGVPEPDLSDSDRPGDPSGPCDGPEIESVTPIRGPAGTIVTVQGKDLFGLGGNAGWVAFGDAPATTVTATPDFPVAGQDSLVVTAPRGFPTGFAVDVTVTTHCESEPWVEPFLYTD